MKKQIASSSTFCGSTFHRDELKSHRVLRKQDSIDRTGSAASIQGLGAGQTGQAGRGSPHQRKGGHAPAPRLVRNKAALTQIRIHTYVSRIEHTPRCLFVRPPKHFHIAYWPSFITSKNPRPKRYLLSESPHQSHFLGLPSP